MEIRFARKWFCKELSHISELKSEQNGSLDAWDPSVPSDGRMWGPGIMAWRATKKPDPWVRPVKPASLRTRCVS